MCTTMYIMSIRKSVFMDDLPLDITEAPSKQTHTNTLTNKKVLQMFFTGLLDPHNKSGPLAIQN